MKISNKDLSTLADTTKEANSTKNAEKIDNPNLLEIETPSHPMALIIEDDESSEVNVVSELKKVNFLYNNDRNRRNRSVTIFNRW